MHLRLDKRNLCIYNIYTNNKGVLCAFSGGISLMSTKSGLAKKLILCVLVILAMAVVFTGCELQDPVTESVYFINDNENNYYNKDHTTSEEAVDEFTDSITALRTYLDSESFVDSGYYMGVDFDIDLLDAENNTVGNFALRIQAYLYTYPHEDEEGNPIYKYYENGQYYDTNNEEGTRTLVSALEIHNEAIKKSDFSIEWYNGATNEVLIGLYFDGINSNSDNPGNILYANIQGYKRSFIDFGDTVIYQQLIRLLCSLSVEGLLESLGLQADAGTGSINSTMVVLIGDNYKRVVNSDIVSLLFYSVTLDAISKNVTEMLEDLLGVFGRKWDPMTYKFLGFRFSTVATAVIESISGDMQAIVSPDKQHVNNVLTNAVFAFNGVVNSYDVLYTYTTNIKFDYGWAYPETLVLDTQDYKPFDYGNYEFQGTLYVPSWDAQFDALIRTDMQQYDNSTNNVFIEFRDIANGELMIGAYYRYERLYIDISGLEYMYGWIDLESLGFPQVYDEHLDLAEVLGKFFRLINNTIVSIVDSILDPEKSDKENKALEYIMAKTSFTEKIATDLFSINSETLQVDIELIKQMLEETGAGTYSTRQIINILDSISPYTMDQLAIMLGIASAEVMLEKTYFTLTWNVDTQEMTMIMYTNVGVEPGEPSTMIFQLEVLPIYFGEYVKISDVDFTDFKPLGQIYTYSGTLNGDFVFSSQETVDLSKLLSATIGESSGLNTPYLLATNAGISFTLIYDQFVTDQEVDGVWKLAGRSAFDLTVWLTGSESSIIITLCSDDVCFDNEVYKDLPAREAELGYVWVSIECVKKNGIQVIPKVKIREDVFMASMSAYMNNETSIGDDVTSFADNDFNLSLTSIISALCKDAYVIAEPEQMEITSSNETLQNLFRVSGLIGNIKVDAGFTYRVMGLEDIRDQYYMYEVGFFKNIEEANSPYDTELHKDLITYFYEDYLREYDPLKYDFYVFRDRILLDDNTIIEDGTMMLFELGAKKTVIRDEIERVSGSFYAQEDENNQDISKVRFMLTALPFIQYANGSYFYYTYYNKVKEIDNDLIEVDADGTIYVKWKAVEDVLFHEEGSAYYYYDMSMALLDEKGNYIYIFAQTERDLLFEYDPDSVKITSACKTQYAPRTNGSFMGEVRRYFIRFSTVYSAELGELESIYHDTASIYPQYYCDEDRDNIVKVYDDEGILISETPTPIALVVMEPCEDLSTSIVMWVKTNAALSEIYTFTAQYLIDWDNVTPKGYSTLTDVIVAPGMMGEKSFPIRIIVVNREIETAERANIFTSEEAYYEESVPVVDQIDVDPYDYAISKYEYMSNPTNFNTSLCFNEAGIQEAYDIALQKFIHQYFAQKEFSFDIKFAWEESIIYQEGIEALYIQKDYSNYTVSTDGSESLTEYQWNFDLCEIGNNLEKNVSPDGGYLYLHTYFKGQLIALRMNVGKREFSYLKFGENDDFNVKEYNKDKASTDAYMHGVYKGNYYDQSSYQIEKQPIFVFVDAMGNEYEYVFDMQIIRGLATNSSGKLSSTYVIEEYGLEWGNPQITYVNTTGSYYQEYEYQYLYSTEFVTGTADYTSLTGAQTAQKVQFIDEHGNVTSGFLYVNDGGKVSTRQRLTYAQLETTFTNNGLTALLDEYVEVDYNVQKRAYKFIDENGGAMIRNDLKTGVNRPFYYYVDVATGETILPRDEKYVDCISGGVGYEIVSDISTQITTTGLNLYYLLRIYFTFDGEKAYSISTVTNEIVKGEVPGDASKTQFKVIPIRIDVECSELAVAHNALQEEDELTGEKYYPAKVNAGEATALGYYKVDPLNAETLILPNEITIYFIDDRNNESSHKFSDLIWGASFDEEGNPVFTYVDENGETQTLIQEISAFSAGDKKRYAIAIDVEKITGTLTFSVMTKIGNEISGYKYVKVCVNVLSKDPTDIKFYVEGRTEPLETQKTVTEITSGETTKQVAYYTYYGNTFSNLQLPTKVEATFSDGHKQNYSVSWRLVDGSEKLVFKPGSLVNLVTTIGTEEDVTVDVYFSVVSENYSVKEIEVSNTYANYYVTMQAKTGEIKEKKALVSELLHSDNEKIGYYGIDGGEAYVRISTGGQNDEGVPANQIGLFVFDEVNSKYELVFSVSVYDFISNIYNRARIVLDKNEFEYEGQDVLVDDTSIFDYNVEVVDAYGNVAERSLKELTQIGYEYDAITKNNVITVKFEIGATVDEKVTLYVDANGYATLKERDGIRSRKILKEELVSYITKENLAIKYVDWLLLEVDGNGIEGGTKTLSEFVGYGSMTGLVYSPLLSLTENSVFKLKNEEKEVEIGYKELSYRLEYYYKHVRVIENTTEVIRDKSMEIVDLYKIMDVSDMVYRNGFIEPKKYIVRLGSTPGSYDLTAKVVFAGGFYLSENSQTASMTEIESYTPLGEAQYVGGYVMGNVVSMKASAIYNDGSGNEKIYQYNVTSIDEKLIRWYVEESTISNVVVGSIITSIPITAIYRTGNQSGGQITMSVLTEEGFRIRKIFTIEDMPETINSSYQGTKEGGFTIDNGVIKIVNVYDYSYPNVETYFATSDYLPTTVSVNVNGKNIVVNDVKWEIAPSWYGGNNAKLDELTYEGTYNAGEIQKYEMATAKILGCDVGDGSGTKTGCINLCVYIAIDTAEVILLPWEDDKIGLSTETIKDGAGVKYVVYVDTYKNVNSSAMTASDTFTLPSTIIAEYTSGLAFEFRDVKYIFANVYEVKKIFFDMEGINILAMTGSNGDLLGYDSSKMSTRYIDFAVDLGLEQKLSVRFYFYDKSLQTVDMGEDGIYTDASAVIEIDDAIIRGQIKEAISSELSVYAGDVYSTVNNNRIEHNLRLIIEKARQIRIENEQILLSAVDSIPVASGSGVSVMSKEEIKELLLQWTEGVESFGYTEQTLPTTVGYDDEQAHDYARILVKEEFYASAENLAQELYDIQRSGASVANKKKNILNTTSNYFSNSMQNAYDNLISAYLQKEFLQLLSKVLDEMTDEEYNYAIYYKNMVHAGFDVDQLIEDVYKLRAIKRSGADIELALSQVELTKAKEVFALDDYDELIVGLVYERLQEAYAYADGKTGNGTNANVNEMATIIKEMAEKRFNFSYYQDGTAQSSATKDYTLIYFISEYAYGDTVDTEGNNIVSKKTMRTYLINLIDEVMDFTEMAIIDSSLTEAFNDLNNEIIGYSMTTISNYSTTIRSMRRSLLSNSSIQGILNNFIVAGINNFINTVYAEKEYLKEIRNIQKINGILIDVEDVDETEGFVKGFKNIVNSNSGKYVIDPYFGYRIVPNKVIVYFDDGSKEKGEEGGFPYVTELIWTNDTISSNITYQGAKGLVQGELISAITLEEDTVSVFVSVRSHVLESEEIQITTQIAEEAKAVITDGTMGTLSNSGQYYMTLSNATNTVNVFRKDDKLASNPSEYNQKGKREYTITFEINGNNEYVVKSISGYDSDGDIMYRFENKYSAEWKLTKQTVSIYNPFEFDASRDLPSEIVIDDSIMRVSWNNLSILPTGNLTSDANNDESRKVVGSIGGKGGQEVFMYVYVAQWNYAGIYEKTTSNTGITHVVDNEIFNFRYMDPLNFYFSAYSNYSAQDYYLVCFRVKMLVENTTTGEMEIKTIIFRKVLGISMVEVVDEGFTKKVFYPEDSRLLEFSIDDETMDKVNERKQYVVYWDATYRNRVINDKLSMLANSSLFLGNDNVGMISLTRLRAKEDTLTPITSTYGYEEMNVDKMQLVQNDGLTIEEEDNVVKITCSNGDTTVSYVLNVQAGTAVCSCGKDATVQSLSGGVFIIKCQESNCAGNLKEITYYSNENRAECSCDTCTLYQEIEETLMEKSGQVTVVMGLNNYYPTTGLIELFENNVTYGQDRLQTRLLWNEKYSTVISNLKAFVAYAYEDVEETARENYAINMLMSWNEMSKGDQEEIISLAKEYMYSLKGAIGNYTEEQMTLDAYKLLAINETYDFTKDVEKIKGGANNAVRVTVLVKVDGGKGVYQQQMSVKVLFLDYSPDVYYEFDSRTNSYKVAEINETNYLTKKRLYIAVRTEYYDVEGTGSEADKVAYDKILDAENNFIRYDSPYDNISINNYKLLQIYSNKTTTDIYNKELRLINRDGVVYRLIEVSNIVWAQKGSSNIITSEKFDINNVTYTSNLLQITLN